ncbi:SMI1/KNR4 family protein [Microbacterium sp. NPDC087665]|uniref:SMI1/KNR4 family protein n=1 Tax=Microbacterium sp. NPDC087665 TaxID=3364194 RepID=UPI00382E92FC
MDSQRPLLLRADTLYVSAPAKESELGRLERALEFRLPAAYRSFLLASDGYDGPVGARGADISLWPVADILRGGYEGPEEAGVVLLGSNGGPTGFGILRTDSSRFVSIPLASSDAAEIRPLGDSFEHFLEAIANGEGW